MADVGQREPSVGCVVWQPPSTAAVTAANTIGANPSTQPNPLIEQIITAPSGPQTGSGNKALTLMSG